MKVVDNCISIKKYIAHRQGTSGSYGNLNYDDALIELKDTFESNGFIGVSAGAYIAEHLNTTKVGTNRPD